VEACNDRLAFCVPLHETASSSCSPGLAALSVSASREAADTCASPCRPTTKKYLGTANFENNLPTGPLLEDVFSRLHHFLRMAAGSEGWWVQSITVFQSAVTAAERRFLFFSGHSLFRWLYPHYKQQWCFLHFAQTWQKYYQLEHCVWQLSSLYASILTTVQQTGNCERFLGFFCYLKCRLESGLLDTWPGPTRKMVVWARSRPPQASLVWSTTLSVWQWPSGAATPRMAQHNDLAPANKDHCASTPNGAVCTVASTVRENYVPTRLTGLTFRRQISTPCSLKKFEFQHPAANPIGVPINRLQAFCPVGPKPHSHTQLQTRWRF
jgi:hypothetical protein